MTVAHPPPGHGFVLASGEAVDEVSPAIGVPASVMRMRLTGAESGGRMTVFEHVIPLEDPGPPLHAHEATDEALTVIEGALLVRLGDDTLSVSAGGFVWIPRRTPHTFTAQDEPARYIGTAAPAGVELFFHAIQEAGNRKDDPPTTSELAARHGITILGPPLDRDTAGSPAVPPGQRRDR